MISYDPKYKTLIEKVYDYKQEHLFAYWKVLNPFEKKSFLEELKEVSFVDLKKNYDLFKQRKKSLPSFSPPPFIPLPQTKLEKKNQEKARAKGLDYLSQKKVAAFMVAGGQGTRLGFSGPKGLFPINSKTGETLFHLHSKKILNASEKIKISIPWVIMTSPANYKETILFFEKNNFFSLDSNKIFFFSQKMIPSLDLEGKLILESQHSLAKNPDGHGGSLSALASSGILDKLFDLGIETLSYFQVDNPLVEIIDPVFLGYHLEKKSSVSSKIVKKTDPKEKVGLLVEFDQKRIGVIEYSDLPPEKSELKNSQGDLLFSLANIAIHLFSLKFIKKITDASQFKFPYHLAQKKIKGIKDGSLVEISALKFEKFIFDCFPLAERQVILETTRDKEFAPIKNLQGKDSLETAQKLLKKNLFL